MASVWFKFVLVSTVRQPRTFHVLNIREKDTSFVGLWFMLALVDASVPTYAIYTQASRYR